MMNNPDESLLLRWSRRKTQARHEAQQETPSETVREEGAKPTVEAPSGADAAPVELSPAAAAENVGEASAPEADIESLPDVETLTYDSDYSVFLRDGVPERLKQAALRRLWLSNPVFANLDGLNDYDPQTMKFLEEAVAEPIAEVGRALRDKIMDAKRAREERPRGRHGPSKQERRASLDQVRDAAPTEPVDLDEDGDDVGAGDVGPDLGPDVGPDLGPPDERRDN